jgi:hypothetical protein
MMGCVDWRLLDITSAAGIIGATLEAIFMQRRLNSKTVKEF